MVNAAHSEAFAILKEKPTVQKAKIRPFPSTRSIAQGIWIANGKSARKGKKNRMSVRNVDKVDKVDNSADK